MDEHDKTDKDKIEFVSGPYVPIMIELAQKYYQVIEFPFYILKSNNEMVKISHDIKELPKTLEHYRQHGLDEIYVDEEYYRLFLVKVRESLERRVSNNSDLTEIAQMYSGVKHHLLKAGLNSFVLMRAEEVNKATMIRINKVKSLSELLNHYRENCHDEFFKYLTMSFLGTVIVDTFPWSTPHIKLKISMAAMFCDISLQKNDYQDWQQWESQFSQGKLSVKIGNHGLDSAKSLMAVDPSIPSEVVQMIEMHHENNLGTGFPGRIAPSQIPLLPAIFIILRDFTDQMMLQMESDGEFDKDKMLEQFYKKYSTGMFHQAAMGLFKAFSYKM
jgi:response regulator RpfG family c-di-GMP phosphodiesterase